MISWARRVAPAAAATGIAALVLRLVVAARQALDGGGADYVAFATGSRILAGGGRCLYCLDQQAAAQIALLGYRPSGASWGPAAFSNPPLAAWLLEPIATLSLQQGLLVFTYLGLFALFGGIVGLIALLPRAHPLWLRAAVVVGGVGSLAAATGVLLGQWDPLLVLPVAAAVSLRARGHGLLAGLLLGVLLIKPQLVALAAIPLIAAGEWALLAGAAGALVAWAGSALLLIGLPRSLDLFAFSRDQFAGQSRVTVSFVSLAGLTGNATAVAAAFAALVAATSAICWLARHRLRGDWEMALGIGLVLSVCCSPHAFSTDMVMAGIAAVLLARRSMTAALVAVVAINVAFVVDEYAVPWGPRLAEALVCAAMAAMMLALARGVRGARPQEAAHRVAVPRDLTPPVAPHRQPTSSRTVVIRTSILSGLVSTAAAPS